MSADPTPASCRAPLLWLTAPVVFGFILGDAFSGAAVGWLWILGTAAASLALWLAWRDSRASAFWWGPLFVSAAALLSWAYYVERLNPPPADYHWLPPREANLDLEVERVFETRADRLTVSGLAEIVGAEPHLRDLVGQRAAFSLLPEIPSMAPVRGEVIHGRGVLSFIPERVDDGFDEYLLGVGVRFKLRSGAILETREEATVFFSWCAAMNTFLREQLRVGAEAKPELADVATGMLLGRRADLTDERKEAFTATGTMHLFAISGLHVGIVALVLHQVLTGLFRLPRPVAVVFGLVLLFLYVEITGERPSAMRAFLMVAFFWAAYAFSRRPDPLSALLASALAVLVWQPLQLWSAGFQLSYAVVAGLLLYGVPVGERLGALPHYDLVPERCLTLRQRLRQLLVRQCGLLLGVSLAAGVASAPLIIENFGVFTPGAVLLNLPLVPLAGLALTGAVASAASGLLFLRPLVVLFNHATFLLVLLMISLVDLAHALPGLFFELRFRFEGAAGLTAALVLTAFVAGHPLRRTRFAVFALLPPSVLALSLLVFSVTA